MSYPWSMHSRKQQRQTARFRSLHVAMWLALSGALSGTLRPAQADTPLAVPLPVPVVTPTSGANVASFGNATISTPDANTLTINQTTDKAIIQWQNFSIDTGHTVEFKQPGTTSSALNRIGGVDPSIILGNLKANGQVYLINPNGILFKQGAVVNVNSLTASTLNIKDDVYKNGELSIADPQQSLQAAYASEGAPQNITIENGATINADAKGGGRIMIIAPNVENQGLITAPDGQIILAAGAKVYLQASDDPSLRGLLVEVDSGGTATNLGTLLAARGNITVVGMAVNQNGIAKATTSVNANGSIYLLARDTALKDTAGTSNLIVTNTHTGNVTLGDKSVTEVTPELTDATTSVDEQGLARSVVTVQGAQVHMAGSSRITAPDGVVTLSATKNPSKLNRKTFLPITATTASSDGSRIYLDAGSRIDVSGTQAVVLPMSHNLVDVELRANELKDSPVQRNGILRGQKVTVDARVGTKLADVTGAIAAIGRTVAERTTDGGTVNLLSQGDVIINAGATIDVSGGWKQYLDGYLNTTQLISAGVAYDIGSASPDRVYDGIAGRYIKTSSRWGIVDTWYAPPGAAGGRYVPGYTEGGNAGTVKIVARTLVQDGTLLGKATVGENQRALRAADRSLTCDLGCQAYTRPLGGQLILGTTDVSSANIPDYGVGDVSFTTQTAPLSIGLNDVLPANQTTFLNTDFLVNGGFSQLAVYSNGRITVPVNTPLETSAGGSIKLQGSTVAVASDLTAPGGTVTLGTGLILGESANTRHDLTVVSGARINARGLWTNDVPQGLTLPALGSTMPNGGNVTLNAFGSITLGTDSLIDVSGGAWVNSAGKQTLGKGGNISLAVTKYDSDLTLNGQMRGYAPGAGGKLSVTANKVNIAPTASVLMPFTLALDPGFFQQGFSTYEVTANQDGLTVASGTTITPLAQNMLLDSSAVRQVSGSNIDSFSHIVTLPAVQRGPVNISLRSITDAAQSLTADAGLLTMESGAAINADTGAALTLTADRRIDMQGVLSAPAGRITLMTRTPNQNIDPGFDAAQSIWLGADSALLARGTTTLLQNDQGLAFGQVLAGGTVTVNAQRGYVIAEHGGQIDVSGTTGKIDLPQANGMYKGTVVASAGGTVNLNASEGMFWDGAITAESGGAGIVGGSLNVALTRNLINPPTSGTPFPNVERRIVVQAEAGAVPMGLTPGAAVPDALSGQAQLNSSLLGNSGFDSISLASDQTVYFKDDPALTLPGALSLDAPQITVADGINVKLNAAYLALGASQNSQLKQAVVQAPTVGSGTLDAHASRLLELIGDVSLSGVKQVDLSSAADLRLRGIPTPKDSPTSLVGSLKTRGNVTVTAAQISPATLSTYTVNLLGADTTFTVQPNGTGPDAVLSATGSFTVNAPNIINNGVIKAPLGTIKLNAGNTLQLGKASTISTSAEGLTIPFGQTQNGTDWTYYFDATNIALQSAPPEKSISLTGKNIDIAAGSVVDLSGGGDLYAYEFVPGPGGSKDVLNSTSLFAVLPDMSGVSNAPIAPFDQQYYQGSMLKPGDSVYLAGGVDLKAGFYTLLPAHYALLPGAYTVSAVAGYQDIQPSSKNSTLLDGSTVMAGYLAGVSGLATDQRLSGFAVRPGTTARTYSEYHDSYANTFFPATVAANAIVSRLPADAGRLAITADSSLTLDGTLNAGATAGARGAQVDIVAPKLEVVTSVDQNVTDAVQLTSGNLNALGAESLLLGATRSSVADGTLLTAGADQVTVGQDVVLTLPELLLAARDTVTVDSGATLTATGKLSNTTPDTLIIGRNGNGDGALLRVSMGLQAAIRRENTSGNKGVLDVHPNATLQALPVINNGQTGPSGSIALDATKDTRFAGTLKVGGGSLSLGASRINLGNVDSGVAGLTLNTAQLGDLTNLNELVLRSYSTVDLYGAAILGTSTKDVPSLNAVTIAAAGLRGFNNDGMTAAITAGSITLGNPGDAHSSGVANGTGTLNLQAVGAPGHGGELMMGAGAFALDGFDTATLAADTQISAQAKGSLRVANDLTLKAPRLTATSRSDYAIAATEHLLIVPSNVPNGLSVSPSAGKLSLAADTIDIAGRVELPAGRLDVTAINGLSIEGAVVATGVAQSFADVTQYMPGGTVALSSASGDINLASAALIDVSGAATGGDAGQLSLSTPQGAVLLNGTVKGNAKNPGATQGSIRIDAGSLGDFSALNTKLNSGGFTAQRTLRARDGDLTIAAADTVIAHDFALTLDNGALSVAGRIDASGPDGGQIALASSQTLKLLSGATLDAHATGTLGKGGSVALMTGDTGSLSLSDATINVLPGYTAGSNGTVTAAGAPGHVYLRAPRTGIDTALNKGGTGVAITGGGSATLPTHFTGAGMTFAGYPELSQPVGLIDITAEAYQVYDNITTIDNALISRVTANNAAFLSHKGAIIDALGMTGSAQFHLTPGVEVQSDGDLALESAWNLYTTGRSFGDGVAGTLTLRAAGDLNLNSPLSDGFNGVLPDSVFKGGSTWAFRLVGGADLNSPDPLALLPATDLADESGNVNLDSGVVVRTGNGRIDVAAGKDISFADQTSVLYTVGTPAASLIGFSAPSGTNYATGGGDISLAAQHDVLGAVTGQMISDWLYRQGVISSAGKIMSDTSWWLSFKDFQQNVGTLGGGDVNVTVGNNVTNLSVVLPTTGRRADIVGQAPDNTLATDIQGGGNLHITAGGDIASGIFYLGKGTGTIRAGGALNSARTVGDSNPDADNIDPAIYTVLAVSDGWFDIQARGDVTLQSVINSTVLPQSSAQSVSVDNSTLFYTYGANSGVAVRSLAGDVGFVNDSTALKDSFSGLQYEGGTGALRQADVNALQVYPGTLAVTAFQGNISTSMPMTLFPEAQGNLQLLAGGSINVGGDFGINLSDTDLSKLPQAANPVSNYKVNDGVITQSLSPNPFNFGKFIKLTHAAVPVHDQPGNPDLQPVRIVAGADIQGNFYLSKSAQIQAGRDLLDLTLQAQNLRSTDISSLVAGRDIVYTLNRQNNGTLGENRGTIEVGGPGALQIQAGGSIDLGTSKGIRTTGNNYNPALPAGGGADISVAAGITTSSDYSAFMVRTLDPAALPTVSDSGYAAAYKYVAALTDFMAAYEGKNQGALSDAQAYADFKALPADVQRQYLQPLMSEVFIDRYLNPAGPTAAYNNKPAVKYTDQLTAYMTAYEGKSNGDLSTTQALADFRGLAPAAQQTFIQRVFFDELRSSGRAAATDGYQRGLDAISSLFPASNYAGDLSLAFSQIKTLAGGDINLLVPGGQVNAGLANPPASLTTVLKKGPSDLGIVAQGPGSINAFTKDDFLVNQSRVFTLDGGNILIWSSIGNIDAGRGSKTAISAPPPVLTIDDSGHVVFSVQGAAQGSGIRVITTAVDVVPGDVDLIAPQGEVNAGDAGIGSAGNVNIAALRVVGADNIQVGGAATGVPSETSGLSSGLAGASSLGGDANKLASDVTKNIGEGGAGGALAYLSVDVLGFGDCKPGDENCPQ